MDYVLGIDSGGTKFLVKAVGMDGRELAEYEGHPAGLYLAAAGCLLAIVSAVAVSWVALVEVLR